VFESCHAFSSHIENYVDQWKVVITLRVEDAEDAKNTQVNRAGEENQPGKPGKQRLMSTMIFLHVKVEVTDQNIP